MVNRRHKTLSNESLKQPYSIMTPGPTQMHPEVLKALAEYETNPDLDPAFVDFYLSTCDKVSRKMAAQGPTVILAGEGILGLEAACASLIEPGDRVLTIANGIFGKGFDDFSKMYGAVTEVFEGDLRRGLDVVELERFIEAHGPFQIATVVQCETPSGITNDLETIGPMLNRYGILSIVDAVSSFGGEHLRVSDWGLDVVLCGSQKVLSAPAGLSTVTLSDRALQKMRRRKSPVAAYYANLTLWLDLAETRRFPYTQPVQMLKALDKALDRLEVPGAVSRHRVIAGAVRETFTKAGFELYAQSGCANTVTSVLLPKGLSFETLFNQMKDVHGILIGGGFDFLTDKIFRVGHMGENLSVERIAQTLDALEASFTALNALPEGGALEQAYSSIFLNQIQLLEAV